MAVEFPRLSEARQLERLVPPKGCVRAVIDTDTYNEVDDQFAVAHSLLSPEFMAVEAIYAAPFSRSGGVTPAEGMEQSYAEILRHLALLGVAAEGLAWRGSTEYLLDLEAPPQSAATADLIERALKSAEDDPLYVVAIGAVTNVASAILQEPKIIEKIVVIWLGGHALHWPSAQEFNLRQDLNASRFIFDCGVPLVHLPAMGVTDRLLTTLAELEVYVKGRGEIGDYLCEIIRGYSDNHFAYSKVIWDIAATAYLVEPAWVSTHVVHSPILTDQMTWSIDHSRHLMRAAYQLNRDAIFGDLFKKLAAHASS